MKIKCIIIDDEPLAIKVIEDHLKNFDQIEIVSTLNNPLKSFRTLESEKIDLIFLDINMPQLSGFEFIETLSYRPLIVITTAYRDHALKSFELDVFDYLVKPIPFTRFLKTVNKVSQQIHLNRGIADLSLQQEPHLFLKVSKKSIKVNLSDILVVESLKDYIKVVTKMGDYVVHKSLTSISEELPQSSFMRVHRSYIISIANIKAIEGTVIEIANSKIPIGRNYSKAVLGRIFNHGDLEN